MAVPTSRLRLAANLPDGPPGTCAHYVPGAALPPGWQRADVRAHCHRHQAEWTDALTRWHAELMAAAEAATPWAWLLPGSRLHVWQEPVRPLLFALGLLQHFREQPGGEVVAIGCPAEVGAYVRELSGGMVEVLGGDPSRDRRRVAFRRIRRRVIETVSMLRRVRPAWRSRASLTPVDLLVVTVGLSSTGLRQRGDHFFGRVLDRTAFRTHWLYQLRGAADRLDIERAIGESGRASSFDHRLVSWTDLLPIARTAARIRRHMAAMAARVPDLHIDGTVSRLFPGRFFDDLFRHASAAPELVLHRVMARLVRALAPRAVCYPYEEKGLERGLLMVCASAARPVTSIGFAHAAYNSGHLYLRASPLGRSQPPRPSVIAAAGSGLGPWLAAECGRRDVVVTVGSPRWRGASDTPRVREADAPLRVLFLVGFPTELLELAGWIDRCRDLFDQCDVTIRPNPQEWHQEQRAALSRLQRAASVTVGGHEPLDVEIAAADVVLFCATSAVAEAIWGGRVAVSVELSDLWTTDPLHGGAKAAGVPECATPDELKATLRSISALDSAEYGRVVSVQRVAAGQVYAPFDAEGLGALVMGDKP